MPERILGIDIGCKTLKAVQISRSLRTVEITGQAVAVLPEKLEPAQVASALKSLISEHGLESDRYMLAVGTQEAFLRRCSFPFRAERKIAQVVNFELEPSLPFGLDEVVVDFIRTERLPDGDQGVLVAALPKRVLDPLMAALKGEGIEPEAVDLDGAVLGIVANELKDKLPERSVVLDIGQRKTNLLYLQQGLTIYLRALTFGCDQLVSTLTRKLEISTDAGFERLFSIELDGSTKAKEEEHVRQVIIKEVEGLAREVTMTLLAAQAKEGSPKPELVVLSGGGSLIRGLSAILEMELELPVRCLAEFDDVGLLSKLKNRSRAVPILAVALGLAIKGRGRRRGFNFLPQKVFSQAHLVYWRKHRRYALVAGMLVALSWLASVGVDFYSKKQYVAKLDEGVERIFRRTLPDFKGSARPAQYASIVKAKIDELNESVALFGNDARHHSSVELLRQISQAIPSNLEVTINMFTFDSELVRMSGRADAFNTVDTVKNRLVESRSFSKVTITGAKAAADGQGVQFSLELSRQPTAGGNP